MAQAFAYYLTQDNTIAEQELQDVDPTSGLSAGTVAREFAKAFGFEVIELTATQWDGKQWDAAYAILERHGYFTAERRAELFDI